MTRIRYEIGSAEVDLPGLRQAFLALQGDGRTSGYFKLADIHGVSQWMCQHSYPFFLPWHRAYIASFEKALGVTLPYWDWTSDQSISSGIPSALSNATWTPPGGVQGPNPLYSAFIPKENRMTLRAIPPANPAALAAFRKLVQSAEGTYSDPSSFSQAIYTPHTNLHGWVGGDMASQDYAAFDPIFWFHHANVDRQWALWQSMNGNPPLPDASASKILDPFGVRAGDMLDYQGNLGYQYDNTGSTPYSIPGRRDLTGLFQIDPVPPRQREVRLRIRLAAPTMKSYLVYVFFNQPEASLETLRDGNPHYAGFFATFGMLGMEAMDSMSPADAVNYYIPVSEAHDLASKNADGIVISLVIVDSSGERRQDLDPSISAMYFESI